MKPLASGNLKPDVYLRVALDLMDANNVGPIGSFPGKRMVSFKSALNSLTFPRFPGWYFLGGHPAISQVINVIISDGVFTF